MPEQIEFYLDKIEELSDTDREYIVKKHAAIVEKVEEIDEILNTHTTGWKTTRMNKVDSYNPSSGCFMRFSGMKMCRRCCNQRGC